MKKLIAALAFATILGGVTAPTEADQAKQSDLIDRCFMQCVAQGSNLSACMAQCIAGAQYLQEMKDNISKSTRISPRSDIIRAWTLDTMW